MKDAKKEKKQKPNKKKKTKNDAENDKDKQTKDAENEEQQMKEAENEKKQPPKRKQPTKNDAENEKKPMKEQPKKKQKQQSSDDETEKKEQQMKDAETEKKPTIDAEGTAKDKKMKPVADMDLGVVRVRYTTQGTKSPIVKLEVREDRFRPTSAWVQRLQVVIRGDGGFTAQQGFNILKTFALCYFEMNLSPTDVNFRQCKSSLLEHGLEIGHNWQEHLSWKYINKLKLKVPPGDNETEKKGGDGDNEDENDDNEDAEEEPSENDPELSEGFQRLGS
ncbi:unnamed protein product, partial [Symbiodinium sp. KB8]